MTSALIHRRVISGGWLDTAGCGWSTGHSTWICLCTVWMVWTVSPVNDALPSMAVVSVQWYVVEVEIQMFRSLQWAPQAPHESIQRPSSLQFSMLSLEVTLAARPLFIYRIITPCSCPGGTVSSGMCFIHTRKIIWFVLFWNHWKDYHRRLDVVLVGRFLKQWSGVLFLCHEKQKQVH